MDIEPIDYLFFLMFGLLVALVAEGYRESRQKKKNLTDTKKGSITVEKVKSNEVKIVGVDLPIWDITVLLLKMIPAGFLYMFILVFIGVAVAGSFGAFIGLVIKIIETIK